jgi:hypothetical protein
MTTVQENVGVSLAYKVEGTFGTAAGASGAQYLRRVNSSLIPGKDSFQSNEVRSDQQVYDMRHGVKRGAGTTGGELSLTSYDDFLEAALRGTWAVGGSYTAGVGTGITASASGKTFTRAGGSWITDGFKLYDVVRFATLSATANNSVNYRIVGLTALVMTVAETVADIVSADESCTCTTVGKKLPIGVVKRSFTLEQTMGDIDISEQYLGARIGGAKFAFPPQGMATVDFDWMTQSYAVLETSASPYFSTPTAQQTTELMAGPSGTIRINNIDYAIITGLDFNVALNLSSTPVVGSTTVPNIYYGRTVITGNVSALFQDAELLNLFVDETAFDMNVMVTVPGTTPNDFMSFSFMRMKMSGISRSIGADGGVVASFPFQALLKTGGSGTIYDQSSMIIQRSNT